MSAICFCSTLSSPKPLKSPPKSLFNPHLACLSLSRTSKPKQINVVGRSSALDSNMLLTPGPGSDINPLGISLSFGASLSKKEKISPTGGHEKETRFEIHSDISTPLLTAPKQSNSLQSQTFIELFPSVLIHCAAVISFIKLLKNTTNSKNNNDNSGGGEGKDGGRGCKDSVKMESPTCTVSLDLRIRSVSSGKISSSGYEKQTEFSFRCVVSVFLFNHTILLNFLKLWAGFPSRILTNLIPWIFSVPTVWSRIIKIGGGGGGGGSGSSVGVVDAVLASRARPLDPLDFESSVFKKEKIIAGHDEGAAQAQILKVSLADARSDIKVKALEAADHGTPINHDLLTTSYPTQFMEPSKSVL